jgi:hypothetical protein
LLTEVNRITYVAVSLLDGDEHTVIVEFVETANMGSASPPADGDVGLELEPDVRNHLNLLDRKVELQARATKRGQRPPW